MIALVVGNECPTEIGLLGPYLASRGYTILFFHREDPAEWKVPSKYDLLVLLGSDQTLVSRRLTDSMKREFKLVDSAAETTIPILGICFGAQVISFVNGGTIRRNPAPEIGWSEVYAVSQDNPTAGLWMQWHYDSFTCPNNFTVIAENKFGIQAICGPRVLGMQFHPEANHAVISAWLRTGGTTEVLAAGVSPISLIGKTRIEVSEAAVRAHALFDWFLTEIALSV